MWGQRWGPGLLLIFLPSIFLPSKPFSGSNPIPHIDAGVPRGLDVTAALMPSSGNTATFVTTNGSRQFFRLR